MGQRQADWRHIGVAVLLLAVLIAGLWKYVLGGPPPLPTAPAPAGGHPIAASPDSP